MVRPTVVNVSALGSTLPGDVYIGRPMAKYPWLHDEGFGNQFKIGRDGDRIHVVELYAKWLDEHPEVVEKLLALQPKRLLCWCAPLLCHGNVLETALFRRQTCDCGAPFDDRARHITHAWPVVPAPADEHRHIPYRNGEPA